MTDRLKLILAACIGTGVFAPGVLVGRGHADTTGKSARRDAGSASERAGFWMRSGDSSATGNGSAAGPAGQFAALGAATEKETKFFSAFREPDDLKRMHDLVEAASVMSIEEMPALVARIRSMPPDAREMLMPFAISRWAQLDPKAAGDCLVSFTDKNGREKAMRYVMAAFVDQNVDAAKNWASSLPPGFHRTNAIQSLITAMAKRDPMKAFAMLQELPPLERGNNGYQNVFGWWARTDAQGAAAKALELPKGGNRDGALRAVVSNWAQNSPQDALAWAKGMQEKPQQASSLLPI